MSRPVGGFLFTNNSLSGGVAHITCMRVCTTCISASHWVLWLSVRSHNTTNMSATDIPATKRLDLLCAALLRCCPYWQVQTKLVLALLQLPLLLQSLTEHATAKRPLQAVRSAAPYKQPSGHCRWGRSTLACHRTASHSIAQHSAAQTYTDCPAGSTNMMSDSEH